MPMDTLDAAQSRVMLAEAALAQGARRPSRAVASRVAGEGGAERRAGAAAEHGHPRAVRRHRRPQDGGGRRERRADSAWREHLDGVGRDRRARGSGHARNGSGRQPRPTSRSCQDGQPAEVTVEAFPDKRYKAVLRQVIPTADRTKATVLTKVTLLEKDKDLKPEMSAKVTFLEPPTAGGPPRTLPVEAGDPRAAERGRHARRRAEGVRSRRRPARMRPVTTGRRAATRWS